MARSHFLRRTSATKHRTIYFYCCILVIFGLSEGASVPLSPQSFELSPELQSLVSSKILMGSTSSSSPSPNVQNLVKVVNKPVLGVSGSRKTSESFVKTGVAVGKASFNLNNGKPTSDSISPGIMSPLHVAQCRATCIEKFSDSSPESTSTPKPTPVKYQKRRWDEDVDEIQTIPKILRLRRKRSAPSPTKRRWNCLKDSPVCSSCWKSCQKLFEVTSSSTRPSGTSSTSSSAPGAVAAAPIEDQGGVNEVVGTNAKQINFPSSSSSSSSSKQFTRLPQSQQNRRPESQSKQSSNSQLACSSKNCDDAGCQVACSFYAQQQLLLAKNGEENEGILEWKAVTIAVDPVVVTRHESGAVKLVPGKIVWSIQNNGEEEGHQENDNGSRMIRSSPVVYVVIQEYPGGKWRQIEQTTDEEFDIPMDLKGTMETKLRSIRVLEVGPEGLRSVYSSEDVNTSSEKSKLSDGIGNGSSVMLQPQTESNTSAGNSESDGDLGGNKSVVTKADYVMSQHSNVNENAVAVVVENKESAYESFDDGTTSKTEDGVAGSSESESTGSGDKFGSKPEEDIFGLRVVSLIHQKSLVIAELKWNAVVEEGDLRQEYLITWELAGGGLMGHLVTDSTTVTLSLWPGTSYQIQVEQFQQNLDSDGEQPAENSSTSLKSQPLTVNTSIAFFPPPHIPSPASSDGEGSARDPLKPHLDEDEFEQSGNEEEAAEAGREEASPHKSIKQVETEEGTTPVTAAISLSATIFVVVILIAAAYFRARFSSSSSSPALKKVPHGSLSFCCFTSGEEKEEDEPHLFSSSSQEDLSQNSHSFAPTFVVGLKKSLGNHKRLQSSLLLGSSQTPFERLKGLDSEAPVAVISSSSSTTATQPYSYLHCYIHGQCVEEQECLFQSTHLLFNSDSDSFRFLRESCFFFYNILIVISSTTTTKNNGPSGSSRGSRSSQ